MRLTVILLVLHVFVYASVYGQEKPKESEAYLNMLKHSKDSLYARILEKFDDYLRTYPLNANVRIERCKVIEKAYYDYYEDYNPNYEEFEVCLNELVRDFPNHVDVLLYKLENVYGDSAIAYCHEILAQNRANPGEWPDKQLALFYEKLAHQYDFEDEKQRVIEYAQIAESLNDTLDLSLLLAQQYIDLNNYDRAKDQLTRSLDTADLPWESRQKGSLLLKLGMPAKALQAFNYARRDSSTWIDNGAVANALIENGMYAEAREFLVKDLNSSYNRSSSLHKLLTYDYKYSPADTALATYNKLTEESFLNDAFGRYRFMMIFRTPLRGWAITDLLKLLLFALVVLVLLIVPYLWVLPLHFISNHYGISA